MPGIVGLITKMPAERAEAELRRMVETLCHENFYVAGTWMDESLGVYAGWVARRNSFSDGMPLRNEAKDVTLIFSGEEFPEPGTAQRLKQKGHELDLAGPSYLVHLYEEDPTFPLGLNGRFHGLLTDGNQGTATLFNDRYGMHRIYYHEAKQAFYFAAEAKAILAVRPELRSLDPQGLGDFVSCGCTLEGRTLFEGIHVLPSASKWVFRQSVAPKKRTYFDPKEWESQEPLEPEAYYKELREVFARNLPRYFAGPERIAMSLTGGLDTRMILAWHKAVPDSLPCYTFGSMFRDTQDVIVGRQVARLCQQPFQVIRVGEEFLSRFSHYANRAVYLTDGCVDVGRAPDLFVNEVARQIGTVRMTGNYGGELLRAVRAFQAEKPEGSLFSQELTRPILRARQVYAELRERHPVSFAVFNQGPWWHYGVLALDQTQMSVRTPYLDNDLVRTAYRSPRPAECNDKSFLQLILDGNPALGRIRTDRGLNSNGNSLGMAKRQFLEFLFRAEYAYDTGMPGWLARIDSVLAPLHVERLFLGRHKPYHFRIWYRNTLADYVREMLLDSRTLSRSFVESAAAKAIVERHTKGIGNHTDLIHKMLTLELVSRHFLERN